LRSHQQHHVCVLPRARPVTLAAKEFVMSLVISRKAAVVVLLCCCAALQSAGPRAQAALQSEATIVERASAFLDAETKVNGFSGSILLARNGKPIIARGYGLANAEWNIPNSPRTKFRLGSITKQFTAMTIMQLQQAGALNVQDSICRHVAPCPDAWQPITIHHLLTHTSGIPSYTSSPSYLKNMMMSKTPVEMVAGFRDLPLEFAPGSQFKYNNSGYFLLGVIIEKATGKSYDRALREQIFTPLGMKDTGYDSSSEILAERASGYSRLDMAVANAAYLDMSQPFSAGALYSTVEDLLKWDQALRTDRLLPKAARDAMFTPFKGNYAYGWIVSQPSPQTFGRLQVAHGGGINGFSTAIIRLPDDDIVAIVLANLQQAPAQRIARDLLAIAFGEPYKTAVVRTVAKVDPSIYDGYVGQYRITPLFVITVTREGNRLMVQASGQPKLEIFPESATRFFLTAVDAQITFAKSPSGAVTHLTLHQNGADQKATRMPEVK
jgi:CubicO group peptidase (beta-lactamase class C family)